MAFYDEMQAIGTELLTEFNQGTIRIARGIKGGGPDYDPGDPVLSWYSLNGVVRGVQQKYVDGTNIIETDSQATVAVSTEITPTISDKIEVDGKQHQILRVIQVPGAGTPVANVLIFRT